MASARKTNCFHIEVIKHLANKGESFGAARRLAKMSVSPKLGVGADQKSDCQQVDELFRGVDVKVDDMNNYLNPKKWPAYLLCLLNVSSRYFVKKSLFVRVTLLLLHVSECGLVPSISWFKRSTKSQQERSQKGSMTIHICCDPCFRQDDVDQLRAFRQQAFQEQSTWRMFLSSRKYDNFESECHNVKEDCAGRAAAKALGNKNGVLQVGLVADWSLLRSNGPFEHTHTHTHTHTHNEPRRVCVGDTQSDLPLY